MDKVREPRYIFPLVSIVLPTYNRAHCISQAIDSVLGQSYGKFELIVIDDGSSDGTEELLAKYGNRVKYFKKENGGVSSARNRGINEARGDMIAFIDSDDLWTHDKLAVQVRELCEHPGAVAHVMDCGIQYVGENEESLFQNKGIIGRPKEWSIIERPFIAALNGAFMTQSLMVRQDILKRVGWFDCKMKIFEDMDFISRLALEGEFIINLAIGSYIRWRPGGGKALSQIYQNNRLEAMEYLINIFENRIRDQRLKPNEKKYLARQISGARYDTAILLGNRGMRKEKYRVMMQSIMDDIGLRSCCRAMLSLVGIWQLVEKYLKPRKNIKQLSRRSEMDLVKRGAREL